MYLDKKAVIVVGAFAAVVIGLLAWNIVATGGATRAAEEATAAVAATTKQCSTCGGSLTRKDVDDALAQLRSDVATNVVMTRGVRDDTLAIRSAQPDLEPIVHFLRFSDAYTEMLLEELARRARVDIGAARAEVDKMFEGHGGKPAGWFWGPVPASP
ncbi:MAG: hypothetical protein HY905_04855 [Deltaproteobacteria bacterium]|nr:hypothetical protein [Deltaproteobacteria bacterium]